MSVTVELPAEVVARLHAEAARRGVSIDEVIAELAAQLPAQDSSGEAISTRRRLSFTGTLSAEPDLAMRAETILDEIVTRNAG